MVNYKSVDLNKLNRKLLIDYFNDNLKGVSKISFEKYINDTLSFNRAEEEILLLKKKSPIDITNKKLLEIGSGFGIFVLNSIINHQVVAYGVEPDQVCYETSKNILSSFGISPEIITNNKGENLPYNDNSFDIVYSSNVLEHVNDPEKVFEEALRVLKKDGYIFFIIPNYASWWEGHYGIIWFPNMPKSIAKLYVKLIGRDSRYLNGLRLITTRDIEKINQRFKERLEILGWGWDIWEHRLITLDFSGWAHLSTLKNILSVISKLGLVSSVKYLGKKFNWLTPIILIGRKKG